MFTVHALPMKDRPFMVQIHLNDQSVAAFSNGESGNLAFIPKQYLGAAVSQDLRPLSDMGLSFDRLVVDENTAES